MLLYFETSDIEADIEALAMQVIESNKWAFKILYELASNKWAFKIWYELASNIRFY